MSKKVEFRNNMNGLEEFLDSIGEKGSIERLEVIATSNLGDRSQAANLVIQKRFRRKELIDKGLSFENAKLIVDKEFAY